MSCDFDYEESVLLFKFCENLLSDRDICIPDDCIRIVNITCFPP